MTSPTPRLASLVYEIAASNTIAESDSVPTEAHLLPVGPFRAGDGRPYDCDAWQLDATIAEQVIARMVAQQNDTLIDYEHQSLRSEWNGQKVVAAGWFHNMEWRDGKGLFAVGVDWTANAKAHIAAKEYRYISCVFFYYERTGEVMEVVSVALTNTPALDGLDSLDVDMAALSKRFNLPTQEIDNMATPEQLAALTVERDGLKTSIAALTAERDGLKTQLAALTTERDALTGKIAEIEAAQLQAALAAENKQRDDLVQAALTDGRLVPAQKAWAEKQALAALTEYLDATDPLSIAKRQAGDGHKTHQAALTKEQSEMARKMGVSEEEFLATQQKYQ